jgi:hypothetical protein
MRDKNSFTNQTSSFFQLECFQIILDLSLQIQEIKSGIRNLKSKIEMAA